MKKHALFLLALVSVVAAVETTPVSVASDSAGAKPVVAIAGKDSVSAKDTVVAKVPLATAAKTLDTITAPSGFTPAKYKGKTFVGKAFIDEISKYPDSKAAYEKSKGPRLLGTILGGVGGFIFGWNVVPGNGTGMLVGAGIAATGIGIAVVSDKHLNESIRLFNQHKKEEATTSLLPPVKVEWCGSGLAVSF